MLLSRRGVSQSKNLFSNYTTFWYCIEFRTKVSGKIKNYLTNRPTMRTLAAD